MKLVFLDSSTMDQNDIDWSPLESTGNLIKYDFSTKEEGLDRASDAEVVIVNKHIVGPEELTAWSDCKLIVVAATGYNNIDLASASKHKIPVCNVAGYSTRSVVQHVFAMLLSFLNHPQYYFDETKGGRWANSRDFCVLDHSVPSLAELCLGVIGSGTIGCEVAKVGNAFGMKILIYSKYPDQYTGPGKTSDLDELFEKCDVISLHVPLNPSTKGMINEEALKKMKPTCILVNTSRGPVVNEDDLYQHLSSNPGKTALLDVLDKEPPDGNNPLFSLSNVHITPHIAWANRQARQLLLQGISDNIIAFKSGSPTNVVN